MKNHITDSIKAVIFDHDDTLVGTIKPKSRQHKHIAKTYYDKILTDDEIRLHWGKPLGELLCLLYGTDNVEEALGYSEGTRARFPKDVFEATIPTLQRIRAAGLLTGLVTATTLDSLMFDFETGLLPRELLDYLQTANDTSYHKPDPRVFDPAKQWLAEHDIDATEVLYIGDGLHDMRAAVGAGFNFVGVHTGLVAAEEFAEHGADSVPDLYGLYGDAAERR
jgi:phosphoglycolate phosphatase-like HAD superfamily hydrolase